MRLETKIKQHTIFIHIRTMAQKNAIMCSFGVLDINTVITETIKKRKEKSTWRCPGDI